jgi:hypothetical protein
MFDSGGYPIHHYAWLLLINVNTRMLWCQQLDPNSPNGFENKFGPKSQQSVLNALQILIPKIQRNDGIQYIRCDSERAFIAKDVVNYLYNQNPKISITQVPKFEGHSNHTSLAIVDRVIRTLRDDAVKKQVPDDDQLKIKNGKRGLRPGVVEWLVDEYNSRVHSALGMAPKHVGALKEQELMNKVSHKNQEVMSSKGYKLDNQTVRIHRQFNPRNKHDRIPYYENATVIGKRGAFYTVVYGGEEFDVPRAKLTVMKNAPRIMAAPKVSAPPPKPKTPPPPKPKTPVTKTTIITRNQAKKSQS